jgi:hypothetical protein
VSNPSAVTFVDAATLQVTMDYAVGFQFISGMALDPKTSGLFVADDPTEGNVPGQGRWWDIGNKSGNIAPNSLIEFASGLTAPGGGAILAGTAINPATGKPFRHLWSSDVGGFGLCRLDPDVDTPGPHTISVLTCLPFVAGVQLKPGQMAFDPASNNLYVVDMQANTKGIFRLHFVPAANNGHGGIDLIHQEIIAGNGGVGHNGLPGCGLAGNVPNSAVLGPDNNLYVGFKASGDILRVVSPQSDPTDCSNVQVIGSTPDNTRDMGLGWIGHDLYGGDGRSAFIIGNADLCLTPQNGMNLCQGSSILPLETRNPTFVTSDQIYPSLNGRNLLVGQAGSIALANPVTSQVTPGWVAGFQFLSAITLDPTNLSVFVADDPSAGVLGQLGHWWQVEPTVVKPAVPGTPLFVKGLPEDAAAIVSWTPAPDGQKITSYTVRTSFSSSGVPVPDVIVTADPATGLVPASVTITGLVNNSEYMFIVAATNDIGTSHFSLPSRLVGPFHPSVSKAPAHVSAGGHDSSATVVWTAVPNYLNGGFPIIAYRVEVDVDGVEVQAETVPALQTIVEINGLKNGTLYTFVVYATNALGDSPASPPSNVVIPAAPAVGAVPGAPTGVSAVAGNGSASVSWIAPASNGGPPVQGYAVHALNNGAFTSITAIVSGLQASATVNGLANGATYTFDVQAVNSSGIGPLSAPSNAVTPGAQAPSTGAVPGVPANVVATAGVNSATVSWTAPTNTGSSSITTYTVVVLAGGFPNGTSITVVAPATQTVVSGLAAGVSYSFMVHAINAAGDSGSSQASNLVTPTPATVPGVPTHVSAVAASSSAHIFWNAPASDGGRPITGYVVVGFINGVPANIKVSLPASTGAVAIRRLASGTTYTFVVHAVNSVGDSGPSATSNAVTPFGTATSSTQPPPPQPPAQPQPQAPPQPPPPQPLPTGPNIRFVPPLGGFLGQGSEPPIIGNDVPRP